MLETDRLRIRRLTAADADFLLELLNDPDFLRQIGDRGVRRYEQAIRYVIDGPDAMFERHGVGLMAVVEKASGASVGICGLLRRAELEGFDLGFAFLAAARGRGYATEASRRVLDDAISRLDLGPSVLAITAPGNDASARVLSKLGFVARGRRSLHDEGEEIELYALELPSGSVP
ncbi:MAG: GNAT family N-acetyltransferase [Acidobacteriota bacterium]